MTAKELLAELERLNIKLEANGDRLRYSPRSAVTPDLAERMKANKLQLLALLRGDRTDNVHFSSKRDDWATPQSLFDELNAEFGFTLDVCATSENAKCNEFFTRHDDGLTQDWSGTCWMNPPYGRTIGKWMAKAHESSVHGATVVCLVPARTDSKWWHDYATQGEIRFLKGRLKFGNATSSAPFPSAIVVFRPTPAQQVAERKCDRCGSTCFKDVPIHEGRSVRRDCRKCGRHVEFAEWYSLKPGECHEVHGRSAE